MLIRGRSYSVSLWPQKNWFLWVGYTPAKPNIASLNIGISITSNLWIPLSPQAEEDLQWWKSAHNVLRGAPVILTEPDTQLFTDASNIGWGAHWNTLTVSGVWTTIEKTLHINVLELEAIHRAMLHWLRKLMGLTVLVLVSYIYKPGGTWSIQLCRRTKKLLLMCQANQIVLRARHIPGKLNVLADILSCPSRMLGTEWSLHPSVFRALTQEWGIPLLDLFATRWNPKLPLFVPRPRPISHGSRCSVNELEDTVGIRIPTTSSVTTGARESAMGQVRTDTQCPTLAPGNVVATTLRDVSTTSTPDTQHSSVTIPASRSDPSRSVQSPATRMESIRDALCNRGFSVDVASRVSRPQRESTVAIYESKWRIFTAWCNIQHINPLSASDNVVSDFLLHLHTEKHLAISTIAGYQMAIASTLHATSGAEVGRNPALKSLLRNIEMEQGQHQRHFPEWNLA